VLFEPLDESAPLRRSSGTQVVSAVLRGPGNEPADADPAADAPPPLRERRPIRASTPRPSGPPAWIIAAVIVAIGAVAYLFLR
jgi:hypothetical protein